jgi:hypothetical protein
VIGLTEDKNDGQYTHAARRYETKQKLSYSFCAKIINKTQQMNFFQTNEQFSLSSSRPKFTGKITLIDSVLPCSRIHFVQKLLFAWGKGVLAGIFLGVLIGPSGGA